ncbi:MAG: hypothetical protein RMN25_01825 [Anaerolineae bacterium]|nr:hypothetical protein [Thermoflexales bacterium]MDW8406493.1 hypothetical protein [Anaerolineae bacterium]
MTFALQVFAWASLILGLLSASAIFLTGVFDWIHLPFVQELPDGTPPTGMMIGVIAGLSIALFTLIQFAVLLAASQLISLLIDMGHNTRLAADAVQRLLALQTALWSQSLTPSPPQFLTDDGPPGYGPAEDSLPEQAPAEPTITAPVSSSSNAQD